MHYSIIIPISKKKELITSAVWQVKQTNQANEINQLWKENNCHGKKSRNFSWAIFQGHEGMPAYITELWEQDCLLKP